MKHIQDYKSFKFLFESEEDVKAAYVPIELEYAAELFHKHCKKHDINSLPIYRGLKSVSEFLFYDSKKVTNRKSANTQNYFTLIVDNSKFWSHLPKRSKSIICTSSHVKSMNYSVNGAKYIVIPFDGTEIAACPESDIWVSFRNIGITTLSDLNTDIFIIMSKIEMANTKLEKTTKATDFTIEMLKQRLELADLDFIERLISDQELNTKRFWTNMKKTHKNAWGFLMKVLTPKDFDIITSNDMADYREKEVYFSSDCILIRMNEFENFKELVKK